MITCKTTYSVELLLGPIARRRRLLCNVIIGIQRHVCLPRRYVHTHTQGPPVWSQSDNLRRAWKSFPPGSGSKPDPSLAHQSQRPGTLGYYYNALDSLLNALRQGDTLKLYLCLLRFVRGHEHDPDASWCFAEVVASIPPTTFSEILRCFDPYNISNEIDTAPGINITYGAAVQTPLGELINKWGVKLLYVRILNRLRRMQEARRHARIRPLLNDYVVLMRCAAATSDIRAAKDIWHAMKDDGYSRWRHSEAFGEFVKARYLTEKLYANNDLARLRLRPLDMHRSSILLPKPIRYRLLWLSLQTTRLKRHRFGENMHELYFAESLTRVLRKKRPLMRLWNTAGLRGMLSGDERLLCAFLKANGRNGRLVGSNRLLERHWGILIHRDKGSGTIQVDGGVTYPPDSPRAPTEHLLDAIVHCYCCMGEIIMAAKLVDFVSRRFGISVPNKVWSDLLEYTHIMQSKPAAREWAIAPFPQKRFTANTILDVWDLCTQEPHNFQPGMRDYYNLIKSLIRRSGSMTKPIGALRQVKPLYDDAVRACEEAWCELLQTTMQHVPNHAAYRRYRMLRARKDHIWYCFHYSSRQILKMISPGRVDDDGGVREIPNLVREFWQFMPTRVEYRVATGYVQFDSDNRFRRNLVEAQQVVEEPQHVSQRRRHVQKQLGLGESLGDQRVAEYWGSAEDHTPSSRDDMQMEEVDARGPEHISRVSTSQQVGEDTVPNPDQDTFPNMSSGIEEESLDGDQRQSPPPFDIRNPSLSIPRWIADTQVAEKPAYGYRPRYSGLSTQPSIVSIRQDGGEFTGYHDDKTLRPFAAHRVMRTTRRTAGVPIDLGLGSLTNEGATGEHDLPDTARLVEQFLWVSTR